LLKGSGMTAHEKLFAQGVEALSDSELLAVLLFPRKNASMIDLAQHLIDAGGGLRSLFAEDPHELCAQLSPKRAAPVLAALELGRRVMRATDNRIRLKNPEAIYDYLRPTLSLMRREVFHVLCLSARGVLLRDVRVAEGTTDVCPVDAREVFAPALAARATTIVLAHNHPSGDPEPSPSDLSMTHHLCVAAPLLGLKVADHIIVGDNRYTSMLSRGQLPISPAIPSHAHSLTQPS
jgi:DNA repair protein RadC